jgi:hypothetical protein
MNIMMLMRVLPIAFIAMTISLPVFADDVMPSHESASTQVPCSLQTSAMIPDYNAKIATLRNGAEQNMIAVNAMTADAQNSPDGQKMVQEARDMYSEAESCQKLADDMMLQVVPPKRLSY